MTKASKQVQPAAGSNKLQTSRERPGGFAARLFGYDIFISFALGPPPRGSQAYASDLARRLREQDLSVFYSEDEAAPGAQLDSTLIKALHRSKILVVLCNRGTLAEPRWVREEVMEFRAKHPERPIIPINIGQALQDPAHSDASQEWLQYRDKIWLDENDEAVAAGITSPEVLERLIIAPRASRANQLWRRLVAGTVFVLAVLAIGAGAAAWIANDRDKRARQELARSTAQRLAAQAEPMLEGDQPGGQERAVLQILAAAALDQPSHELDQALHALNGRLQSVVKLVDLGSTIQTVAFSPDDRRIVMGGIGLPRGDRLEFFDADTLQRIETPISRFEQTPDSAGVSVHAAKFNPQNADQVAWTGAPPGHLPEDGWTQELIIWDLATHQEVSQRHPFSGATTGLEYSPDGRFIAVLNNGLQIWDVATGQPLGEPVDTGNDVTTDVDFSPDGRFVLTTGLLQTSIWPFDSETGTLSDPMFLDFRPQRYKARFNADGTQVATGDGSGIVTFWDARTGAEIARNPEGAEWDSSRTAQKIEAIEYVPRLPLLVTAHADGQLLVRRANVMRRGNIGSILGELDSGEKRSLRALAVSHDGTRMALGGNSGTLRIMGLPGNFLRDQDGTPAFTAGSERMSTYRMEDDLRSAMTSFVKSMRFRRELHKTETNPTEYLYDADGSPEEISAFAESLSGGYIATGAANGTVRVGPAQDFDAYLSHLTFEEAEEWVLPGSEDRSAAEGGPVVLGGGVMARRPTPGEDLPVWQNSRLFTISNKPVVRLAVSDDGLFVLADTGSGLQLWNAETGRLIGDVTGLPSMDGWVGPAGWVDALCAKITRNMTMEEWSRWVSPEIEYRIQCPSLPIRRAYSVPAQ